ncbi:hypothetical protein D6833_10770 [Candidatus Parcubacteria bacterium]|nr:MAG: hypothetical protein D6833_10770 [Candidatus Parcubacteria bacterium]
MKAFLRVALRDFLKVGAVFPSSRYTARRIVSLAPRQCKMVVEYGAGNGAITRALLWSPVLAPNGTLIAVEQNAEFCKTLRTIPDPRLKVYEGDAATFCNRFLLSGKRADLIVSGIPFSFLSPAARKMLLRKTYSILCGGGVLIVYQHSPLLVGCLQDIFGNVQRSVEWRNFPPYVVLRSAKAPPRDDKFSTASC